MKKVTSIILLFLSYASLLCAQTNPSNDITILNPNGNIRDGYYISPNIFLRRCDTYYIIDYCPPQLNIIADEGLIYLEALDSIFEADFGIDLLVHHLFDPGYPELPFYSLSLQFPIGSTLEDVVMVPMNDCDTSNILAWDELLETLNEGVLPEYRYSMTLSGMYKPSQLCFSNYTCPFQYEESYYSGSDDTWNQLYNIYKVDSIGYKKTQGINFSIFPLQYHPLNKELWVLQPTRFYIKYTCLDPTGECNLMNTLNLHTEDLDVVSFYDSYTRDEKELVYPYSERGDYLIISEDSYVNSQHLTEFINHKEALGYTMHIESFSSTNYDDGARIYAIKNKIRQHYQNDDNLRYVLLVGSEIALPPSEGMVLNYSSYHDAPQLFETQAEYPPTDIYYECFDSNDDKKLFPKVIVGRWLIHNSYELSNVVDKTISEEFRTNEYSLVMFSGIDSSNIFNTNYYEDDCEIAANLMMHSGAYVEVHNGVGYTNEYAATQFFTNTLQERNFWMMMYSGHGDVGYIGNPFIVFASYLYGRYCPFSLGYTCLTNSYYNGAFGKEAITLENYGFCAYYGSSAFSYNRPCRDNIKILFDFLKNNPTKNYSIGEILNITEQKYYTNKKNNTYCRQFIKSFYLSGDPSLYIYGVNNLIEEPMFQRHHQHLSDISKDNSNDSIHINENIIRYFFDCYGNKLFMLQGNNEIPSKLSKGLYFVISVDDCQNIITKEKINVQ